MDTRSDSFSAICYSMFILLNFSRIFPRKLLPILSEITCQHVSPENLQSSTSPHSLQRFFPSSPLILSRKRLTLCRLDDPGCRDSRDPFFFLIQWNAVASAVNERVLPQFRQWFKIHAVKCHQCPTKYRPRCRET